jgi:hypothetical protein
VAVNYKLSKLLYACKHHCGGTNAVWWHSISELLDYICEYKSNHENGVVEKMVGQKKGVEVDMYVIV